MDILYNDHPFKPIHADGNLTSFSHLRLDDQLVAGRMFQIISFAGYVFYECK